MINLNFNTMTKKELRTYVIKNPSDREAFRIFVDRFTVNTSSEIFAMPQSVTDLQEIENLIKQKLEQSS
ncbi:hypothetical protein HC246_00770 [Pseudanabaena yagii GIHE-NHR1]|uniref:Uncharacterized protein n=2 Tax=Pseudanabaena TaxID=1152 RepID=A0ABX1LKF8_9CYAN|nr:hypothetical protein [Pseudanabaena yagii GIHE-NHR1]